MTTKPMAIKTGKMKGKTKSTKLVVAERGSLIETRIHLEKPLISTRGGKLFQYANIT